MPTWAVLVLSFLFAWWATYCIASAIRESAGRLTQTIEERLIHLMQSIDELKVDVEFRLSAIERQMTPMAAVAAHRLERIGWERVGPLQRKLDETLQAVDKENRKEILRRIEESRAEAEWKQRDMETQAKLREDKKVRLREIKSRRGEHPEERSE